MSDKPDLRECPFCGESKYLQLYKTNPDHWHYVVTCYCCGAESGWSRNRETSAEKWNTRTTNHEIAALKELMIEALGFLDSGETYREQYYDEMFELVDKLREAAK